MTACVKNHSKRVALAISASLVGALTLGAAAPAAFAAEIDTQFAEGSVDGSEFAEGTINGLKLTDTDGTIHNPAENSKGVKEVKLSDTVNLPLTVSVKSVTPAGSYKEEEVSSDSNYRVRVYKADEDGNPTGAPLSGDRILTAGEYVVTVQALAGSKYENQVFAEQLNVVGAKLPKNVNAYQDEDEKDETFVFTGSELSVDHFVNSDNPSEKLVEGVDYTVVYKQAGKEVELKEAGTYNAVLTGIGKYSGSSATYRIEVKPFTISLKTEVVIAPFTEEAPSTAESICNTDANGNKTYLDTDLVGIACDDDTISDLGFYDFYVSSVESDSIILGKQVAAGKPVAQGHKVAELATFKYGNADLVDSYELDASANETFNTAALKAYRGNTLIGDMHIDVTKDGVAASTSDLDKGTPGVYTVTVTCSDDTSHRYAGTQVFTVTIWKGVINADTNLWVYDVAGDNTAITSYAKAFDGTAITTDNFRVAGKDAAGNKVASYPNTGDIIKTLKDANGETIDSAVSAGEYVLEVTSKHYKLTGTTELPITIAKVDLTTLEISKVEMWNDVAGEKYVSYDDLKGHSFAASRQVIANLGLEAGTVPSIADEKIRIPENVDTRVQYNDEGEWKDVGSVATFGKGYYRVVASVGEDVASNYVLPEGETEVVIPFTVAEKGRFSDVQYSDWCYDAVEKAVANGYMNGYAGTTSFGPWDKLTRGQVAIVLYNMSGASKTWNEGNETNSSYDESKGWVTGFGDVDGHAYYAKAIAWAKSTGVVEGYKDGSGKFGPDDPVTREQFAQMMANYAKVVNRDVTVDQADPASLDEMSDGGKVSGWAQKAVAWAVENDVMGSQGSVMPQDTMDRAMCAQMTVNYQPNAKPKR